MGAEFVTETFLAKAEHYNREERQRVLALYNASYEEACYMYGHGGYTGTIAESEGLRFGNHDVFANAEEAREWLDENCEKWGKTIAVQFLSEDGVPYWMFGGIYSS